MDPKRQITIFERQLDGMEHAGNGSGILTNEQRAARLQELFEDTDPANDWRRARAIEILEEARAQRDKAVAAEAEDSESERG
jgi:hypothetical protein